MRHALIDSATNICVNIIEWDGIANWSPPDGHLLVPLGNDHKGIGWKWDGATLSIPPDPLPPEPVDPMAELREALKADPSLLDKIKALK